MPAEAIGKTRLTKEKEKAKEKEKLQAATDANISPQKIASADAQASFVTKSPGNNISASEGGQGQSIQTQSKPEYVPMEDINHEPLGETQANTSQLDTPESQLSRSTNDAAPTGLIPDISMSESDNSDQESELLADFETLNLTNGPSGVLDGFGGKGRNAFVILRDGPRNAPLYHYLRTNGFNTEGFKNLSYHRITRFEYENEKEEMVPLYTKKNIAGIVGITCEDRPNKREYKRRPDTWVKIKWKNIKLEHRNLLVGLDRDVSKRTSSWITRTDLIDLVGSKAADIKIIEAWKKQEEKHGQWLRSERQTVDRSPTPCPLEVFAANREQREGSQGLSPPDRMTPGWIEPSNPSGSNNVGIQPQETVIKEETEDNTSLFVPAAAPVTQISPSNTAGQENQGKQPQGPLRFSYNSFLNGVKKREKWHLLSEEDQERKLAEAEVRWDRYSETRRRKGDIEEDD